PAAEVAAACVGKDSDGRWEEAVAGAALASGRSKEGVGGRCAGGAATVVEMQRKEEMADG
ncbi:hypothetical protein BHM03_00060750, partial [Ensete ventricosum]